MIEFLFYAAVFPDKQHQGFPSEILTYFWDLSSILILQTFLKDMSRTMIVSSELLGTYTSKTDTTQHIDYDTYSKGFQNISNIKKSPMYLGLIFSCHSEREDFVLHVLYSIFITVSIKKNNNNKRNILFFHNSCFFHATELYSFVLFQLIHYVRPTYICRSFIIISPQFL